MPDDLDIILKLEKQGTSSSEGCFAPIPITTLASRYIATGRYVIQRDLRGRPVGYLLHGVPKAGAMMSISQALIDVDHRLRGHGISVVKTVIERATIANVRAIKVRSAENLESNSFWLAHGFQWTKQDTPNNKRNRAIDTYILDLWPRLF